MTHTSSFQHGCSSVDEFCLDSQLHILCSVNNTERLHCIFYHLDTAIEQTAVTTLTYHFGNEILMLSFYLGYEQILILNIFQQSHTFHSQFRPRLRDSTINRVINRVVQAKSEVALGDCYKQLKVHDWCSIDIWSICHMRNPPKIDRELVRHSACERRCHRLCVFTFATSSDAVLGVALTSAG
jgi:hypothetical protein